MPTDVPWTLLSLRRQSMCRLSAAGFAGTVVLCWDLPRHSSAPGQKAWTWASCVGLCDAAPGGRTPRSVFPLREHGQLFSAQQWWRVYIYVKRSSSSPGGGSVSIRFSLSWGFLSVEWGPVFDVSLTRCPGEQQTEREPPMHHLAQNPNKVSLPKEFLIRIFDWLCSRTCAVRDWLSPNSPCAQTA